MTNSTNSKLRLTVNDFTTKIANHTQSGTQIGTIDVNSAACLDLTFSLSQESLAGGLEVDANSGALIDFEATSVFRAVVLVNRAGQSLEVNVTITIDELNAFQMAT